MQQFRKKPVVVEAVQITDQTFDADHPNPEHLAGVVYDPEHRCVFIETLEGTHRGDVGDWIIRGVKGELYPCKPDIFTATYDQVLPGMSFGLALESMKKGLPVARAGWNGKGMWLMLITPTEYNVTKAEALGRVKLPWIGMKTADGGFVPWLASQTDLLADDWKTVGLEVFA